MDTPVYTTGAETVNTVPYFYVDLSLFAPLHLADSYTFVGVVKMAQALK